MLASLFNYHADGTIEARHHERCDILLPGRVALETGELVKVSVLNVSKNGFMAIWDGHAEAGERIELELAGHLPKTATIRWAEAERLGCEFEKPLSWDDFVSICKSHGVEEDSLRKRGRPRSAILRPKAAPGASGSPAKAEFI